MEQTTNSNATKNLVKSTKQVPPAPKLASATNKNIYLAWKKQYNEYLIENPAGEQPKSAGECLTMVAFEDIKALAKTFQDKDVTLPTDLSDKDIFDLCNKLHMPRTELGVTDRLRNFEMKTPAYADCVAYNTQYRVILRETDTALHPKEKELVKLFTSGLKPDNLAQMAKRQNFETLDEVANFALKTALKIQQEKDDVDLYYASASATIADPQIRDKKKRPNSEPPAPTSEIRHGNRQKKYKNDTGIAGTSMTEKKDAETECWRCGEVGHTKNTCKKEVKCEKCGRTNHITAKCRANDNFQTAVNPVATSSRPNTTTPSISSHHSPSSAKLQCRYCGVTGHVAFSCPVRKFAEEQMKNNGSKPTTGKNLRCQQWQQ